MNGYCKSGNTSTKDAHFREIVETHVKITKAIMNRHHWVHPVYYYFDLNAGPGIDSDGRRGSPVIFQEIATKHGIMHRAYFFEQNRKTAQILSIYLEKSRLSSNAKVVVGNNADTFPAYFNMTGHGNIYGLVYSDPSGNIPPFDLLGEWSIYPAFLRTDVLIYISSANVKRALNSPSSRYDRRLSELIKLINKKHWIIRKPQGKHQWTFLMGTNWINFPAFQSIGFFKIESPEGEEIMFKLDHTNKEIKDGA